MFPGPSVITGASENKSKMVHQLLSHCRYHYLHMDIVAAFCTTSDHITAIFTAAGETEAKSPSFITFNDSKPNKLNTRYG